MAWDHLPTCAIPERSPTPYTGRGGHVAHLGVPDVQVHEHVVRVAVARIEMVEVEQPEHPTADHGVAGLRVGDVPVARGDLRPERENRVAEVAAVGDQLPRLAREEPVRLRVVDLAARDGGARGERGCPDSSGCRRSSRLKTSGAVLERLPVAGHDRRAGARRFARGRSRRPWIGLCRDARACRRFRRADVSSTT